MSAQHPAKAAELVINLATAKSARPQYSRESTTLAADRIRPLLRCMSPLLAQSGHPQLHRTCPLSGVKRTSDLERAMSCHIKRQRLYSLAADCTGNCHGDALDLSFAAFAGDFDCKAVLAEEIFD